MNILNVTGLICIGILLGLYIKGNIGEEKCKDKGYNGYQYSMGCYLRNGEN